MNGRSVVIVGAGLAGARCAETLRAEGFDGDLVLVGEEPVAPYERPALSKEFLAGSKNADDLLLRPRSFWAEQRIELVLGQRVDSVDRTRGTVTTSSGLELGWDTLVLATGARPRQLPFASPAGVHVLRTLADAEALRDELLPGARLAIVGGGFVGAEVASTARSLGVRRDVARGGIGSVRAGARAPSSAPGSRAGTAITASTSAPRRPRPGSGRRPPDASMRSSSPMGP